MIDTADTRASGAGALMDPEGLMRLRNLEWRARVIVEGFWTGIHRSPYHGFSVEFTEYRQYTPGDDLRYLDWRVLARTDRYFLKRFEDETNLRAHLVVDQSRSMGYGSVGYTKGEYGATLAAALARFLHTQGDAVGLLTFDEGVREYLPARHRQGHLRQLILALDRPGGGRATDLAAPMRRVAELVRKRGVVVVVSDFLAPLERWEGALMEVAAGGHEVVVFHLLDPAEASFGFEAPAVFEDVETGRRLLIDPGAVRGEYVAKVGAHGAEVRRTCERLGAAYVRLVTNQPLQRALFDFLRSRSERGKGVKHGVRRQAHGVGLGGGGSG